MSILRTDLSDFILRGDDDFWFASTAEELASFVPAGFFDPQLHEKAWF